VLALARERGVLDRVEYRGVVQPDEVPSVLAGATAGLSPLREDQFGALVFSMKVPEYIAAGLPVVCSRTRTMRHYYAEDELTFFEPNDAKDLGRAIREVLCDPDGARERTARGMSKLEELDWSAQRKVLIETVDSLVEDGSGPPAPDPGAAIGPVDRTAKGSSAGDHAGVVVELASSDPRRDECSPLPVREVHGS
jgi:glycosyltransferase involved in cell wall biosynthesis